MPERELEGHSDVADLLKRRTAYPAATGNRRPDVQLRDDRSVEGKVSPALPTREPKTRGSRSGGSPSLAVQPGASAAASKPSSGHPCDFCRRSLIRGERHRLVWESAAGEFMLAWLCGGGAEEQKSLADGYGGHGGRAIALVSEASPPTTSRRMFASLARGAVYVLIALTFFLIVTLFSSLSR